MPNNNDVLRPGVLTPECSRKGANVKCLTMSPMLTWSSFKPRHQRNQWMNTNFLGLINIKGEVGRKVSFR